MNIDKLFHRIATGQTTVEDAKDLASALSKARGRLRAAYNFAAFSAVLWVVFLILALVASARAADLGVSLAADYYLGGDVPAGWYLEDSPRRIYGADATIHVAQGDFRFAVSPYLIGNGSPDLGGLRIGAGYQAGPAMLSVYHHSCHNLDQAAATVYDSDVRGYVEAPACNYNALRVRLDLGATFAPLW